MTIKFIEEVPEENEENTKEDFIKELLNKKLDKHLTFDDFCDLKTKLISDITQILCKYIKETISIVNDKIFVYDTKLKIHFKINGKIEVDSFLSTFLTYFIDKSFKNLSEKQQKQLQNPFLGQNINKKILDCIKSNLRVDESKFLNPKLGEIHFMNGYINLKDKTFRQRVRTNYMTYCIMRNYIPSKKGKREHIEKLYKQIYPDKDDYNGVFESFSEAMTGESIKSQYNLFLLGKGSSGKSTIMKMCKTSFQNMVFQLKEDGLAVNNNKNDRMLNMLMYNPFVRLIWINELKGKIDDSLYKQLVEGVIHTTSLFKEGQNEILHNALLIITSNEFPNIKIDTGIVRRLRALEHQSQFKYDKKEVNEKNNIYLANTNLMEEFERDEDLQNAFVEIIVDYAYDFLNGKRYELSKNFKETKTNIVDTNDLIKEYIESHIEKTDNDSDKISLETLYNEFKSINPTSRITIQQFLSSLKDKDLNYNSNLRFNGVSKRGGFYGVIHKNELEEEESPLDYGFNKNTIQEKDKRIKELENEIIKLKSQLEALQPKPEPKQGEIKVIKSTKSTKSSKNVIDAVDIDVDELELELSKFL